MGYSSICELRRSSWQLSHLSTAYTDQLHLSNLWCIPIKGKAVKGCAIKLSLSVLCRQRLCRLGLPSGLYSCPQQNPDRLCVRAHKPVDSARPFRRTINGIVCAIRVLPSGFLLLFVKTTLLTLLRAKRLWTSTLLASLLSELCHHGCAIKGLLVPAEETSLALPTRNRLWTHTASPLDCIISAISCAVTVLPSGLWSCLQGKPRWRCRQATGFEPQHCPPERGFPLSAQEAQAGAV